MKVSIGKLRTAARLSVEFSLKARATEDAGKFARVTYIQPVATQGGVPPSKGCEQSHAGTEVPADYQAAYYF
jgi:hypothetical protein